MGVRPDRWFLLRAITLLGAGLLAMAYFVQRRESQRNSAPAPEPAWRSADRSAAFLEHQIRVLGAGDSIVPQRIVARLRDCKLVEATSDSLRVHMTRSLNSGHEFEADIVLARRAVETGQDLTLDVTRGSEERVRLRVEVRAGAITTISQAAGMPGAWQPWTGAQDLPLALGDLQLGELLALCQAFADGKFEPRGYLDGMGARPQLVLEASLAPTERGSSPSGEHNENPATGQRALAYVDSATCALRSVRVFDGKGYVVRVYDDLVWETSDSSLRLSELRVTSMPSSSHTVFRRAVVRQAEK